MAAAASATRDILVIGASAGGLEALKALVGGFEPGLPASVLVVLHVGGSSQLPGILDRSGPLWPCRRNRASDWSMPRSTSPCRFPSAAA
jgi:two-component system chemotaxis response regulator CheB